MNSSLEQLFTEKFRPKDFANLIAPDRIKRTLSKGLVLNTLLYGSPGTGKTSTMWIIAKGHPTLYINGRDAKAEFVGGQLARFCSTISLDGGKERLKCVLIDEVDGATAAFFDAIKVPIEKYSNMARFIVATNYVQKIPEGVFSRFDRISFDPLNAQEEEYLMTEYKKRIALILTAAKITYTDEILHKFVKNEFPDMRQLMTKIQSLYLQEVHELTEKNYNINYDYEDLFKICFNKPDKAYQNYKFIVGEYASRIDDALNALGQDLIEYIKSNVPTKADKIPMIIIAVAEHQSQRTLVIDPLITLLSCVYKIQLIINS
jgi:DNA polymerase III delta prime subunit